MTKNLKIYKQLLSEDVDEGLIESIEILQASKMLEVMRPFNMFNYIPDELNHILIELVIYRFNRIGSEGMTSETKTQGSENYDIDYEDKLLSKCIDYAKEKSELNESWRIKFI